MTITASSSVGRSWVATTTQTCFALCRNSIASARDRPASRLTNEKNVPARSEQHAFDESFGVRRAVRTERHKCVGRARLTCGNIGDVVSEYIEPPDLGHPIKHL